MSSSPILGNSPSSPRFSVFEVSRWSTTWFDEEEGVDSIFIWGNFFQPRPQEVTNSQSHDDHGYYHQLELCKSPGLDLILDLILTSPSQVPGSCFTSRCSIFTRATWLGAPRFELEPRSELESGNIGCDVSSAGSCLIVGGEMVFVTPHFFTSADNLSERGREQELDLALALLGLPERVWFGLDGRGNRPRNGWWPQPDLPAGKPHG